MIWALLLTAGASAQTLTVSQLSAGDLVITEVMQNPDLSDDLDGEWLELYNNAGASVDLLGLEVQDNGTDYATVDVSTVVLAGGYAVIGKNGDTGYNGGVTLDAVVNPLTLANGADELILSVSGTVIDEVWWDDGATFPDPTGASMSLDPGARNSVANDTGSNWCQGTTAYGAGDLGSPGTANPSCSGGTTGTGTGAATGTGTGAGTGGGTGTGAATGGTSTGTGSGTGGTDTGTTDTGGTASGGTGTGTGFGGTATGTAPTTPPTYDKLGCGCSATGSFTPVWWLALLAFAFRREAR